MERNDFLKKMLAGAAVPSLLAGCSANEEAGNGILDPGNGESAAKVSNIELDVSKYEYHLECRDFNKCYLNITSEYKDVFGMAGIATLSKSWHCPTTAQFFKNTKIMTLTVMDGDYFSITALIDYIEFYRNRYCMAGIMHHLFRGESTSKGIGMWMNKGTLPGI